MPVTNAQIVINNGAVQTVVQPIIPSITIGAGTPAVGSFGPAGGDLSGTYPNPSIADGAVDLTTAKVTGILPIAKGGTGSASKIWWELAGTSQLTALTTIDRTVNRLNFNGTTGRVDIVNSGAGFINVTTVNGSINIADNGSSGYISVDASTGSGRVQIFGKNSSLTMGDGTATGGGSLGFGADFTINDQRALGSGRGGLKYITDPTGGSGVTSLSIMPKAYNDTRLIGLTFANSPSTGYVPVYNGTNFTWQGTITNTAANNELMKSDGTNAVPSGIYSTSGVNVGVSLTVPTARLHLPAGAGTTGTASLKIDGGTLLSITENYAVETTSTHLYWTDGSGNRFQIDQQAGVTTIAVGTTTITSGTSGRIPFNSSGTYQEDANLFWNNTNKRLGIGTSSPATALHVAFDNASTNNNLDVLTIVRTTSGTPANGIGGNITFQTEAQSGTNVISSLVQSVVTDVSTGAEFSELRIATLGTGTLIDRAVIDAYGLRTIQYRLDSLNTAPSSASDTGTTGEIRWTSTFVYLCTATNTWVRAALATW